MQWQGIKKVLYFKVVSLMVIVMNDIYSPLYPQRVVKGD